MVKSLALILSGNAFRSLMLLVRNLIIARLISLEDFGIAATFAISVAIVEMASGLGLQQLIVQDKSGEDPKLQAGVQGFNLVRGIFAGAALFLLADPIARFLGVPEITWAYQILALVPVMIGLEHFDIHRLNRKMRFGPLILTKSIPAFLSVLSVWPLYLAFGDFRVMLFSILLQWALTIVGSHIVAHRRFRVSFNSAMVRKSLRFGWPLLINNVLLFLIFQGDRLLVGRELGMEMLAVFSIGITFTLTPMLVSAQSEQQFFLPQLSAAQDDHPRFVPLALTAMQASLASGLLFVMTITLLADPLVSVLLGAKYAALAGLLPWLAIWQAMRAFKVGNTVVALSLAQTSNAMIANAVRSMTFPLAWWVLLSGGTLLHIVWIATAGEFCAYLVSLWLVLRRAKLPLAPLVLPFAGCLSTLIAIGAVCAFGMEHETSGLVGWAVILLLALGTIACMRELRSYFDKRFWKSGQTR